MRLTPYIAALLSFLAFTATAQAEKRVALVIGNGAYEATTRLANPPSDAADMAAALAKLGFEVVAVVDGDRAAMTAAIRRFGKMSAGADVALFYYAGHGIQVGSTNYMLPVSANLGSEQDLEFEAIEVGLPLRLMDQSRAKVKLVVLDACRNNPLAQTLASSMQAGGRGAAVGRGLARIQGAEGTLMAFATAPGSIADDGKARNSPFTRALLANIGTPGLEVSLLFRRVRSDVMRTTGNQQVPWVDEALLGEFYFVPPIAAAAAPAAQPAAPAQSAEIVFWNAIEDSTEWSDFQAYLDTYGNEGAFAALALVRRDRLIAQSVASTSGTDREVAAVDATAAPSDQAPAAPATGLDGRWAGELVTTDGACRGSIPVVLTLVDASAEARLDDVCSIEGRYWRGGHGLILGLCGPRHYRITLAPSAGGVGGTWTSMTGDVSSAAHAPAPRDCIGRIEVERVGG